MQRCQRGLGKPPNNHQDKNSNRTQKQARFQEARLAGRLRLRWQDHERQIDPVPGQHNQGDSTQYPGRALADRNSSTTNGIPQFNARSRISHTGHVPRLRRRK